MTFDPHLHIARSLESIAIGCVELAIPNLVGVALGRALVSVSVLELFSISFNMGNALPRPLFRGFWGETPRRYGDIQFSPPKGTSLRQSASIKLSSIEIDLVVLPVGVSENKKKKVTPHPNVTPMWKSPH